LAGDDKKPAAAICINGLGIERCEVWTLAAGLRCHVGGVMVVAVRFAGERTHAAGTMKDAASDVNELKPRSALVSRAPGVALAIDRAPTYWRRSPVR